jgi:hypothetical protein
MINGGTVDFPASEEPTVEQVAAQKRSDRAERISRLRETLRENQWLGPADQITVAQAANDLLVWIEKERGIRKAKILEAAGIANKNKRDYAIPRNLSSEEIERLSRRLKKRTEPYKKIVEAAARVVPGLDEGDLLLDVFGQANIRLTRGHRPGDGFEELALRLQFVANGISAKYKLTEFFREVEQAGVSPALVPESVQRDAENKDLFGEEIAIKYSSPAGIDWDFGETTSSHLGWPIELNQFTSLCRSEECDDLPAYPLVVLGAWTLGSPFPISIVRPASEAKAPVSARGWTAVVLSFCIAPIGRERSATPVLRVDLCAYVVVDGSTGGWAPLRLGKVPVGDYELNIEEVPKLSPPFGPSDIERHASVGKWPRFPDILFLPINGALCEHWFSFPACEDRYNVDYDRSVPHPALGDSLILTFYPLVPFSPLGNGTLAALVDRALCDPTAGLDMLLEQQVERLKDAFEASRTAARDLRDKNWEVVKEKWAQAGNDASRNVRDGGYSPKSPGKPEANGEAES